MPASDDRHDNRRIPARRGAERSAAIERLERRDLCAAGAPAGFVPFTADYRLYQLTINADIAPAPDEDFFLLGPLKAGDVLSVAQSGAGSSRGTLTDSRVVLYRRGSIPDSPVPEAIDDDSGSGNDSMIFKKIIPVDDVYFLQAMAGFPSWTGTYALSALLESRVDVVPGASAGALSAEQEPNGFISTANDASGAWRRVDYVSSWDGLIGSTPATSSNLFPYELRAGDVVTLQVDSSSDLDVNLQVLEGSQANILAADRGDGSRTAADERDAQILSYRVPRDGVYDVRVGGNNGTVGPYRAVVYLSREESSVVGRYVFYNNSVYDGRSPAAGPSDDGALAADKVALLPGRAATVANLTNSLAGINGVMIDIQGADANVTAADFRFEMSAATPAGSWVDAPAPSSVLRRPGAGVATSDRFTLVWPDGAIVNRWLRVTLKASDATRLPADDVFLFGNLVGETGDDVTGATVTVADMLRTRAAAGTTADRNCWFDFNRDGRVNALDQAIARGQVSRSIPLSFAAPSPPAPLGETASDGVRPRSMPRRRTWFDAEVGLLT